jgi:general secretion pathway protein K
MRGQFQWREGLVFGVRSGLPLGLSWVCTGGSWSDLKRVKAARGAALLLVLWAILLLTAAVLGWVKVVQQGIIVSGRSGLEVEALAMAHSGVTMGLHPMVSQDSPQLERDFSGQMGYRVRMEGEGGRLNLNWLLAGEDPRRLLILKRWMEGLGLELEEREALVDCLLDYVDGDNLKHINGAEDDGDYHPANRPFLNLGEVGRVPGAGMLMRVPGWSDALTLYSQGRIDISSAPIEVIQLLPGLGQTQVERFVQYRNGRDGEVGTQDDPPMTNVQGVQQLLGLTGAQWKQLEALLTLKDNVVRISARGFSGKVVRQVEVVARKGGATPTILLWNE